jgi:hypothetical protein
MQCNVGVVRYGRMMVSIVEARSFKVKVKVFMKAFEEAEVCITPSLLNFGNGLRRLIDVTFRVNSPPVFVVRGARFRPQSSFGCDGLGKYAGTCR